MEKKISVQELIESISGQYRVLGKLDRYVSKPSPIDHAEEESLSFYDRGIEQTAQVITKSHAGIIVCSDKIEFSEQDYKYKTIIQVANPRLIYIRLLQRYFVSVVLSGTHPTAIINEEAKIGPDVYIGPYCYLGKCEIGEGTVIYGNAYIYPKTKIGKRVTIHAGTVIGVPGYSFVRNEKNELERFPQLGGVTIGDNVELGSNVSIECGALENTVIGKGTKIANMVLIGHNVKIGKHCQIIDQAFIAGSVSIGDYTWIGPHAVIRDWINVGRHVLVGMGSVVTKDIGDKIVVMGVPARKVRQNITEIQCSTIQD